jgi:uncharacterized protein YdeI (YjbR/CyaY-like superfamily)
MAAATTPPTDLPVQHFPTQKDWEAWLDANHATSPGIWLRIAKKSSGIPTVTYDEAVEAALCYGWIDGQKKSYDDLFWLQKFTKRGARSVWSKINRNKAEALIASGRMRPAGLRAVEAAKADGRWEAAYDGPATISVPEDLQAALDANEAARACFATLNRTNRNAILWRIQTARRPETRAKRIEQFVAMLERGEKLYP